MGGVSAKAAFTHGNAFTYTRGALITHTRDITDQVTTESCKQSESNGWLVFRIWHLPLQQCFKMHYYFIFLCWKQQSIKERVILSVMHVDMVLICFNMKFKGRHTSITRFTMSSKFFSLNTMVSKYH